MWQLTTCLAVAGLIASWFWWLRRQQIWQAQLEEVKRQQARQIEDHQRDLAQQEAQRQTLFDSMIEGLLLLDKHGCVQIVNQALEKMFGLSTNVRGQTIMEAFRRHQLQDLVNRVAAEGRVVGFELELPGLDNQVLRVNAASLPDHAGKPQGMILVFHDLTRLKELERARKEFVANVSHELRTPLSLIKGYVETLIDGAKDDAEVSLKFLQIIEKHADRLTYLIEDLLTISQLESGQIVMNMQAEELRPLVERVLQDLAKPAADKQVTLQNEIPGGLRVHADSDRVQQVLYNLVDNAVKYGATGNQVTLGARSVGEGMVEVSVRDRGPGIPPDSLPRIFERFYRVERGRSRELGGTGLGLAIVKHVVQSHGGEVRVESELDHGSTFFFTLPRE